LQDEVAAVDKEQPGKYVDIPAFMKHLDK
jgi:hypothetical protein